MDSPALGQWVPVSSSNVEAVRWLGREYFDVRFLAKGGRAGSTYRYFSARARELYLAMLAAGSKGHWLWANVKTTGIPYKRIG